INNISVELKPVWSASFNATETQIALGSRDGIVRIWEIDSGNVIRVMTDFIPCSEPEFESGITALDLSHDGSFVITATSCQMLVGKGGGIVRLWETEYTDYIEYACTRVFRDFTNEERDIFGIDDALTCTSSGLPQLQIGDVLVTQQQSSEQNTLVDQENLEPTPIDDVTVDFVLAEPDYSAGGFEISGALCFDLNTQNLVAMSMADTSVGIRIRYQPDLEARQIGGVPAGERVILLNGPVCNDGYEWWLINYFGNIGWVASSDANGTWFDTLDEQRPALLSPFSTSISATYQQFERGEMIWFHPFDQVIIKYDDGTWNVFIDTYQSGQVEIDSNLIPPEGYLQPARNLGKVWRENESVFSQLGWAVTPEISYTANYSYTFGGTVGQDGSYTDGIGYRQFNTPTGAKYILYDTNQWQPE
ncbi:MAG: SH3 domain-containing protein, partial [Anaerolineae bacterium]|nr:SH3 domain-containing protein [Anaerolineae bacterium]